MSILVMNVYGPGHDAFYRARDTYGGKPGIAFLTAGEAVDREGNPIVVGEGEALDAKARAKRKTLPLAQVGRFYAVGVGVGLGGRSRQRNNGNNNHTTDTTTANISTGAQTNSGPGESPQSRGGARRALPLHGGRHALVRGRRGGHRADA